MKHIFYIHSNVTYMVALAIIKLYNLSKNEVRLTFARIPFIKGKEGYVTENLGRIFDQTYEYNSFTKRITLQKSNYKTFDEFINKFSKDDFILYIPQVYGRTVQALISHPKCKQVNIIEEGLMAYYYNDVYLKDFYYNLPLKKRCKECINRVLFYLGMGRRFSPKHFYDFSVIRKKYKPIFYGLSDNSFKFMNNITIKKVEPVFHDTKNIFNKNSHIIVFDSLVEAKMVEEDIFFDSLEYMLDDINSDEVYIKFHPSQDQRIKNKIKTLIIQKKRFKEIASGIILEEHFINSPEKSLTVYGYVSSLLIYAKLAKQNVKSYAFLLNKDEEYKNYMKKINLNIENFI